jgi:predicted nucleic acid binding AN1-type Zn finger protein
MELPPGIKIKENSFVAKLAARKLKSQNMAIVFGSTIHLHGVSRQQFLQTAHWVRHELKHVEQYQQHGYLPFLCKYLVEWVKKGYENNRFEVEAREAESGPIS